jgi:hypothetical protein
VTLQARAPVPALREALASVAGVRAVQVHSPPDDPGRPTAECQIDAADSVEAAIARAVATRWDLLRLERHEPTLENVFLRYVQEPAPRERP